MSLIFSDTDKAAAAVVQKVSAIISAITPEKVKALDEHLDLFITGASLNLADLSKEAAVIGGDVDELVRKGMSTLARFDSVLGEAEGLLAAFKAGVMVIPVPKVQ